VDFHLSIDDVENFQHRPSRSTKAADDLKVEAAFTLFPKEGEIRRVERPIYAGHFESTKPRKLLFLAVYLDSDDFPVARQNCSRKKSGHEASEKVVKNTEIRL
jgi:hypothetical protein